MTSTKVNTSFPKLLFKDGLSGYLRRLNKNSRRRSRNMRLLQRNIPIEILPTRKKAEDVGNKHSKQKRKKSTKPSKSANFQNNVKVDRDIQKVIKPTVKLRSSNIEKVEKVDQSIQVIRKPFSLENVRIYDKSDQNIQTNLRMFDLPPLDVHYCKNYTKLPSIEEIDEILKYREALTYKKSKIKNEMDKLISSYHSNKQQLLMDNQNIKNDVSKKPYKVAHSIESNETQYQRFKRKMRKFRTHKYNKSKKDFQNIINETKQFLKLLKYRINTKKTHTIGTCTIDSYPSDCKNSTRSSSTNVVETIIYSIIDKSKVNPAPSTFRYSGGDIPSSTYFSRYNSDRKQSNSRLKLSYDNIGDTLPELISFRNNDKQHPSSSISYLYKIKNYDTTLSTNERVESPIKSLEKSNAKYDTSPQLQENEKTDYCESSYDSPKDKIADFSHFNDNISDNTVCCNRACCSQTINFNSKKYSDPKNGPDTVSISKNTTNEFVKEVLQESKLNDSADWSCRATLCLTDSECGEIAIKKNKPDPSCGKQKKIKQLKHHHLKYEKW